jgi:hypothetical protein
MGSPLIEMENELKQPSAQPASELKLYRMKHSLKEE